MCLQSLKYYYSKVIIDVVKDRDYEFSKLEFLARIITIYLQIFKKNIIRKSFKQTGLILFNLEIVI